MQVKQILIRMLNYTVLPIDSHVSVSSSSGPIAFRRQVANLAWCQEQIIEYTQFSLDLQTGVMKDTSKLWQIWGKY